MEVAIPGSPSLIVLMAYVDVKQHENTSRTEPRSCVKVEVAVLVVLMASVDVKQH